MRNVFKDTKHSIKSITKTNHSAGDKSHRWWFGKSLILSIISSVILYVLALNQCFAHEAWVLTPEQFAEWNAKPRPEMFTSFNETNITLLALSLFFILGVIFIERRKYLTNSKSLDFNLSKYSDYAALGVRWSLAVMLGMAAFGLSPRHGTEVFEASTLVAPDLEIRLLGDNWQWLAWAQGIATVTLLLGAYVRTTAFIILCIDIIGLFVFGYKMFAYAGIVGGVAIYLLVAGAGKYTLHLPVPDIFKPIQKFLDSQTVYRAQFLMRLLAGINLVYLGIAYKFFQPNLSLAFIEMQNVFTFGLRPETFVFCMFLVETIAGLLMVLGMLMRPLSVVLFGAFMFLAYALGENPLGHIIFYGILWSCLINGSGRWFLRQDIQRFQKPVLQEQKIVPSFEKSSKKAVGEN